MEYQLFVVGQASTTHNPDPLLKEGIYIYIIIYISFLILNGSLKVRKEYIYIYIKWLLRGVYKGIKDYANK